MRRAFLVILTALLALDGLAFAPREEAGSLERKVRSLGYSLATTVEAEEPGAPREALDGFLQARGGRWWGRLHASSGRASLVSGSGLALVPGRGNGLGGAPVTDLADLEPILKTVIDAHPGLLGAGDADLELSPARSAMIDGGRVAFVDFDLARAGRRVRGARVFFRINSGNLIQMGTRLAGGTFGPAQPVLDEDAAYAALFDYLGGRTEVDRLADEPDLFFLPVEGPGGLVYRLVWSVSFTRTGEAPLWTGHVDAASGEVIEFFDANAYGQATGGVYPRTVTDAEVVHPMPFVSVGGNVADLNGVFTYTGGLISNGLEGPYFQTNCEDGCSNPSQALASADLGLGWLRFGAGGVDEVGNGVSTKAERNAYYHMNLSRLLAKKWLDIGWFDALITVNVNIQNTCNASWGGNSANFYRAGGGCNNTGEVADVMQHEWGHGLDGNTNGGDSATGEATGDHVAFLMHHSPIIGPYFRTGGGGVRDLDRTTDPKGLLTVDNVATKCGTGPCLGPLGTECHCEGEIYGQAGWELSQALVAKHGLNTGWLESERLFFESLPQVDTYLPGQPQNAYDAYLAVDDDDGNLNNGTPNGQEIFDTFDLHGMANANRGSSAGCTRPAEPVVNTSVDCGAVNLSWDAIPGAVEYRIMRNAYLPDKAYLDLARVTGTSYADTQVSPDIQYHYVVQAIDGTGCESTIEASVSAFGPAKPVAGLVAVATDDVPAGNRSGTVDPGEAVDLLLTLDNATSTAATGLVGVLSTSTPGITLDVDTQSFPDLAGLGSTTNTTGFRFSIGSGVACGETADFTFTVTDDSGCAVGTQYFSVDIGVDEAREQDTFEVDNGWAHDAASSTATSGDWTRGVPDATSQQPGSDSDDAGVNAWYTAPNAGGAGADDVDGGEVILLSPVFDLSALTDAEVSYQRWFGNRDVGEDPDDYFWVEASDDGGSSWSTVELLGSNVSAAAWTQVSFDLGSVISLSSQVRFRVRVSDGTLDGNLIEGAFDDFKVTEAVCDLTPPCFVPPTFAGLGSALPGADCAETDLAWLAATSNCTNAEITYNVYRSTDPAFTPDPSNRVASGLTGLSFADSLLVPGQTYHYVARAFDSRSGEETNLGRVAVVSPTGPDTKAPIFSGLAAVVSGSDCGEAEVSWSAGLESCSTPVAYEVYRSTTQGFTPGPANLVASTTDTTLVDAGLTPNQDYFYVVRAKDQAGNLDVNAVEGTAEATVLAEVLTTEDFESGAAGWGRSGLNDATTGLWELGDPAGTSAQPGDCPSGTSCWVTGASGPGLGDNDIDGGTTTLLSSSFSLAGLTEPGIRYARYYSNNTGGAPALDTWLVEISDDDGGTWTTVESTTASDDGGVFTQVEFPVTAPLTATSQMRMRFTASDLGEGSVVEAEVDDFRTVDLAGGCDGCGAPPTVGTILVTKAGQDDLALDWTADPVSAGRFKVYTLGAADFSDTTVIGTTDTKSYTHPAGQALEEFLAYRVSAVDACGQEGALQ